MKILLSNDDGVYAKGIFVLYEALSKIADVTVIAPDRNCSGASNSLTLLNPLRATQLENGFYSVNGTPTDCVHLGINQLLDEEPDLVVAGINNGANLGYMGTAMVRQLDRQGQQLKLYQFNGIWPVTIGDIALDFGTNDTVAEYSCTWAVQYWHGAGANADDIKGREIDPNDSDATPVAGSLRKTIS